MVDLTGVEQSTGPILLGPDVRRLLPGEIFTFVRRPGVIVGPCGIVVRFLPTDFGFAFGPRGGDAKCEARAGGQKQHGGERAARQNRRTVSAVRFLQPVAERRRARLHRVAGQIPLDVLRQVRRTVVATGAVLLQAPHYDPVELAAHQPGQPARVGAPLRRYGREGGPERGQPRARPRRLLLLDDPANLVERRLAEAVAIERRGSGEKFYRRAERRASRRRCRVSTSKVDSTSACFPDSYRAASRSSAPNRV